MILPLLARLHSTILKRWDGIVIPFFSARSCASVCLVFTESNNCDSVFLGGQGMILTINLSDHLCEIYLLMFFTISSLLTLFKSSSLGSVFLDSVLCLNSGFGIGFHVLGLPKYFGMAS